MSSSPNFDKQVLRNMLTAYEPSSEIEKAFRERMLFLLNNYPNCFERSLLHAHFTASAWLVNRELTHCLLTHHAKLNRWLQLGGHADGDSELRRVCLKEVTEESGLKDICLADGEIFDLDIHFIPERKGIPGHDHYDVRFLVYGNMDETIQINHESNSMKWVKLEEAKTYFLENDSISRMISKTEKLRN
ncbi:MULTISPECIES: NUDIX hydrolase [Roseivirga]|nr:MULTISPECIES: NUDIX hydrolase [Roseivirga]WPZ12351.1 NUDIX hydrolase [Roseivirga spongicola]